MAGISSGLSGGGRTGGGAGVSLSPKTVAEGSASGTIVGKLMTSVAGATLSIVSGPATLNATTKEVALTAAAGLAGTAQRVRVKAERADPFLSITQDIDITSVVSGVPITPTLVLAGALTFTTATAAGTTVATIANVPAGVTPTLTPNDGRLAIAGDATNGWKVVVGLTASSVGDIALTVAATGANSASATVTVTSAVQPVTIRGAPNYMATAQSGAVGANRGDFGRRPFYVGSGGASDLRISYVNDFAVRNAESGNSLTVKSVYLEKGDGSVSVQLTFDGGAATSKALAWKDTDIQTDPVLPSAFGLTQFDPYSQWWLREVTEVPLTTDKKLGVAAVRTGFTGFTAYAYDPTSFPSLTAAGTGPIDGTGKTALTASNKYFTGIVLGRALVPAKAFLGVGDSFTRDNDGEAGQTNLPLRLFGDVFERALVNEAGTQIEAFLNTGVYGTGVTSYNASTDARRAYYKYATDFHDEYGVNDSAAGAATIQTRLAALWATYKAESPNCRIWRTLIFSGTNTTDSFLTEANQSLLGLASPGGYVDTVNAWLLTKQADGTLTGIIPWGRVRGVTSFSKWRVNDSAYWTLGSGLHPTPWAGIPLMAAEARSIMLANVQAVPSALTLTATASDRAITVTWPLAGAACSDYLVEISPAGANTWTSKHTYDDVAGFCFTTLDYVANTPLTAATSYDIRVTPINSKGSGPVATLTKATIAQPAGLLFDNLTAAPVAAYSWLRRKGSYKGPAARVMRTVDQDEIDLHYDVNNKADEAWLAAWAKGSSVRVRRREDVTGNGKPQVCDYTSNSKVSWPYLVINGVLQRDGNGNLAEQLSDTYKYATSTLSNNLTFRTVYAVVTPTNFAAIRSVVGSSANSCFVLTANTGGNPVIAKLNTTNIGTGTAALTAGAAAQVAATYDLSAWTQRKNGAANGGSTNVQTLNSGAFIILGNSPNLGSGFLGQIPEAVIFEGAALSGADQALMDASRSAYGIS